MSKTAHAASFLKHAFDSRKDYIVIGLCGKPGAGCTTAAQILHTPYPALQLRQIPLRGPSFDELYHQRECQIIQRYAEKYWEPFEVIKASALLTAHALQDTHEQLAGFLSDIAQAQAEYDAPPDYRTLCRQFFQTAMYIDLSAFQEMAEAAGPEALLAAAASAFHTMPARSAAMRFWTDLQTDRADRPAESAFTGSFLWRPENLQVTFAPNTSWIRLSNVELYRLFRSFCRHQEAKESLRHPILCFILKQYIYHDLPAWCAALWSGADRLCPVSAAAKQLLGIHLRLFREPYDTGAARFEENGYTILAEDMNYAIKLLRSCHRLLSELQSTSLHTRIVIDSIQNPFESRYLGDRYSNYFLFGIYTGEEERRRRYTEAGKDTALLEALDDLERRPLSAEWPAQESSCLLRTLRCYEERYPAQKAQFPYILQNISTSIESADVFFNNHAESPARLSLKIGLVRYVCLMIHPGLVLPTPVERNMQIAFMAKLNSGCLSRQVGAVITDAQYHLLSVGWNQQPEGQFPCSYRDAASLCTPDGMDETGELIYSDYERGDEFQNALTAAEQAYEMSRIASEDGIPAYFCFKDIYNSMTGEVDFSFARSLHAEETAFLNLGANGSAARGGYLFTTSSPCIACAKKAMQFQISKIYYIEQYPGIQQKHILSAGASGKRPEMVLPTGAVGKAYIQLYTPIMPLKDEDELRMGQKMTARLAKEQQSKQKTIRPHS